MKAQKTPALSVLSTMIILSLSTYHPVLAEEVQFNTDVLDVKDRDNISLEQFSHAGYIMPGDYAFTVAVNGHALNGEQTIRYFQDEQDKNNSLICVPQDVANQLGLKEEFAKKLTWWHDNQCLT
jgi:outer membrane usher protein FimD/PapC